MTVGEIENLDSATAPVEPSATRWRSAWVREVIGVCAVVIVVVAGYAEIPFAGKTFSTSLLAPGARVCGTHSTDACLAGVPNDPRFDHGASAWALEPWVDVVHRDLAQHQVPLWNPYQGIGAPLAANMQSSAFDPLLLPAHVHPTLLIEDLSFLAALVLIGLGAYFAARMLRVGILGAVASGAIFGLSGWFFVYSNNAWFRVYVYLPFLIGLCEWIIRSRRRLPVALLGIGIAAMFAIGMPEPAFISMVAVGLFAACRIFIGERAGSWWCAAARLCGGAAIGIVLAAPLLLVFREYVPLSLNNHSALGNVAPETDSPTFLLNWLMPRISPRIASDTRYSINFGFSRNWVGAAAILLAIVALMLPRRARRVHALVPVVAMGAVLALQIYGGGLVSWTRHIPAWSQVLWAVFGTPVLALTIALLAGMGIDGIEKREVKAKHILVSAGVLVALALVSVLASSHQLAFGSNGFFRGGWGLALIALVAVLVIATVPSVHRYAPVLLVAVVVAELLLLAPRGFYAPREEPYPSTALTTFLSDHTGDGSRIFSPDGVLFPDTAGVYGLSDPRMLDALYIDRYWTYLRSFISRRITDRFTATGPTEGAPNVAGNAMLDLLGVRYVLYRDRLGTGPPSWSGEQYRKVFRSDGVTVYENTHVAPRAFVAPRVKRVSGQDAALHALIAGENEYFPDGSTIVANKDPRQLAIVESDAPVRAGAPACVEPLDSARVTNISSDRVEVDVDSKCGGVLVLSDAYYPGWTATVNAKSAEIHPTDIAFRGVEVPRGRSTVVFRYAPSSFRMGLVLFTAGVISLLALLVIGIRASRWWRRRHRRTRTDARSVPVRAAPGMPTVET